MIDKSLRTIIVVVSLAIFGSANATTASMDIVLSGYDLDSSNVGVVAETIQQELEDRHLIDGETSMQLDNVVFNECQVVASVDFNPIIEVLSQPLCVNPLREYPIDMTDQALFPNKSTVDLLRCFDYSGIIQEYYIPAVCIDHCSGNGVEQMVDAISSAGIPVILDDFPVILGERR